VPAINLAIYWEHFLKNLIESQSLGNLFDLNLLRILREYTPEINFCNNLILLNYKNSYNYSSVSTQKENYKNSYNYSSVSTQKDDNYKFSSYLTGLIEGDGSIIVPKYERSSKGKLNYPSIQIVFHLKDLPLALLIQKNLRFGSLLRKKGVNAYVIYIHNYEGVLKIINLLNGQMRTPKINSLFKLID
jgi:hypothetical protein